MERFTPGTTTYTLVIAVRLREPLDEDRLLRALAALPVRHEGLRHRFPETEEGRPAVHVVDTTEVPLNRTTAVTDEEAIALIGAETAVPLDLARGPLLKCVVVSKGEDEHIVALLVHHIVADGQSLNLLMRDLLALSRGEEPPAPAVRFGDVALWQRERSPDRELDYWRGSWPGCRASNSSPTGPVRPSRRSTAPPTCAPSRRIWWTASPRWAGSTAPPRS
ncbi:hypothetical protein GCM10027612_61830 [Microbispora bryophytorum subsp. camponoti]